MSLTSALAIFFIIWWVTLFAVLPFGVRTQQEEGDIVPGSVPSAPAQHRMWRVALITTAIALVVFSLVYLNLTRHWITLDDFPLPMKSW